MKPRIFLPWLALVIWLTGRAAGAAESGGRYEVKLLSKDGTQAFDFNTGVVKAQGGVLVRYENEQGKAAELTAQQVSLNQRTGDVQAEGSVFLRGEGQIWRGEQLAYNFKSKVIKAEEFRSGARPFFLGGFALQAATTNNLYTATNTFFTTDDVADPSYRVRCRSLVIIPGSASRRIKPPCIWAACQ